jgi:ATP-binding cassette subfamily C (CFTR/MRP) protein 1
MFGIALTLCASVSAHIVEECLLGMTKGRTRILVTHHLEVAREADWVIVMDNGRIVDQGIFSSIQDNEVFRLLQSEENEDDTLKSEVAISLRHDPMFSQSDVSKAENTSITKIHLDEERNTGAISWATYGTYLKAMATGGYCFLAIVTFSLIAAELAQVGNVLFLGFWSASSIPGFDKGHYMGVYAAFGVALGLFTFTGAYTAFLAGLQASYTMFYRALMGVLRSPVAFHDRTPSGRIQSRQAFTRYPWRRTYHLPTSPDWRKMSSRLTMSLSFIGSSS